MQLQTACSVLNAAWSARLRASCCSRCYSQCAQCQRECACSRVQCSVAFCHIYLFVNFWFRMYCIYRVGGWVVWLFGCCGCCGCCGCSGCFGKGLTRWVCMSTEHHDATTVPETHLHELITCTMSSYLRLKTRLPRPPYRTHTLSGKSMRESTSGSAFTVAEKTLEIRRKPLF